MVQKSNPHLGKVHRMVCGWLFLAQHQKRMKLRLMQLVHHLHHAFPPIALPVASALSQNTHSPLCRWYQEGANDFGCVRDDERSEWMTSGDSVAVNCTLVFDVLKCNKTSKPFGTLNRRPKYFILLFIYCPLQLIRKNRLRSSTFSINLRPCRTALARCCSAVTATKLSSPRQAVVADAVVV